MCVWVKCDLNCDYKFQNEKKLNYFFSNNRFYCGLLSVLWNNRKNHIEKSGRDKHDNLIIVFIAATYLYITFNFIMLI